MTRFTASTESEAVVSAPRSSVWRVLTDPAKIAQLTPLLERVVADGDLWRWEMARIPVLGVSVAPSFTERMSFDPERRIDFTHAPPGGAAERGAVEGWYELDEVPAGTRLAIRLELCVDLPLPRVARAGVNRVMAGVMAHMGDRFAANLLRELDAAPVP
jgi:carbon monoxide dehydrogenase subunit G